MKSLLLVFVTAALTAALTCDVVRRLAVRHGLVSKPGGRNVHSRETPRLGGIAIYLAVVLPLLVLLRVESALGHVLRLSSSALFGLLGGATLIFAVGFLDDLRGLRASHKLAAQVIVAGLVYALGFRITVLQVPLVGAVSTGFLAAPLTVLWVVGVVNAINLIDGLDGLAGGILFFAGLTNIVVALVTRGYFTAIVMTVLVGALVGFLYHNFNPAKIFMGDGGSYLLGYMFSVTVLNGSTQKASAAVSLVVPCIALGVPIFDTLFSIVRRALERRPIFSPDRGHIHHRLLDIGLTHRRAVLALYCASVMFCVTAIAISFGRAWQVGVALALSGVGCVAFFRMTGFHAKSAQAPNAPGPEANGSRRDSSHEPIAT